MDFFLTYWTVQYVINTYERSLRRDGKIHIKEERLDECSYAEKEQEIRI